jgi:hypothetical protein
MQSCGMRVPQLLPPQPLLFYDQSTHWAPRICRPAPDARRVGGEFGVVLRFRESRRAHVQLAAAGCAILNLTALLPLIVVRFLRRAGSAIGSVQGARVTGSVVMWRRMGTPASRSGFDRIAGLSELFRMGVWQLFRTSRMAQYWSGRKKS